MSAVSAQQDGADQPPEAAVAASDSANGSAIDRQLDVLTVQAVLAETQIDSVPQDAQCQKNKPAGQFANLHDILSLFIRAISISVLTSALFFGLAILATANRVGTKSLQIHDLSFSFASLVTKVSVPAFLAMALMNEVLLLVFREAHGERQAVDRAKILLPILSMIECGLFGWLLFSQDDRGPKETMLIAGASLAASSAGHCKCCCLRRWLVSKMMTAAQPRGLPSLCCWARRFSGE